MKIPNKVIPYKDSSISKFPIVLSILAKGDMTPSELYANIRKNKIMDITEFVEVLDSLYAMNKIDILGEVLHYVD